MLKEIGFSLSFPYLMGNLLRNSMLVSVKIHYYDLWTMNLEDTKMASDLENFLTMREYSLKAYLGVLSCEIKMLAMF